MRQIARLCVLVVLCLGAAGCSLNILRLKKPVVAPVACDPAVAGCILAQVPTEDTIRPQHRAGMTSTAKGLVEGRSAAVLDKTTEAEKQAAIAGAAGAEREIGTTVATLGEVGEQGFWVKTPLVKAKAEGRIVWADNGNSINVTLIPIEGAATSGSRISLAAMRGLGIPLTALADLIVFTK